MIAAVAGTAARPNPALMMTKARPAWDTSRSRSSTPTRPVVSTAVSPAVRSGSGYFVARTGYDGNHRCYMANVDPNSGALSYDTAFRDEYNGALGIDFNRKDWPNHPDGGFYKPHSMVFVTPEAVGK